MILTQNNKTALLSIQQMYAADRAAMAGGTPGTALMDAAGAAVARAIRLRWRPRPTVILCGPGNNGGDGFVAASYLKQAGWPVIVSLFGLPEGLPPDARAAYDDWCRLCLEAGVGNATVSFEPSCLSNAGLIVDALFGAGLQRPLGGVAADVVEAAVSQVAQTGIPVVAVDMPSGMNGNTGQVDGAVLPADVTVTFFRGKTGHHLHPGAALCGTLVVADIGIPATVLHEITPTVAVNDPVLWREALPVPQPDGHKYDRGHVLVLAGAMPGAAVLAARAAARAGAGIVTLGQFLPAKVESSSAFQVAIPASLITANFSSVEQLLQFCRDRKVQTIVLGPGFGRNADSARIIAEILQDQPNCILDADGISAFAGLPYGLDRMIGPETVLTPHAGEFSRIIPVDPDSAEPGKLARTVAAAARFRATIVHKGADTIVASADGQAIINANGPAYLASAGTGDVLAGLIGGLRAQGMAAFAAAAAAVWLHADAAHRVGAGLIADDLPDAIPESFQSL